MIALDKKYTRFHNIEMLKIIQNYNSIKFCNRFFSYYSETILNVLQNGNFGDKVNIKGWVKSTRKLKENIFIDLADGSTGRKLQVVLPKKIVNGVGTGASVTVTGTVHKSPKGDVEIQGEHIEVYGKCIIADGYPYAPRKSYPPEYVRQYLHLRPRTNKFASLLRVRSSAVVAIHNYFNLEGYVNIQTPILTSNDCEGAGEVFKTIPNNMELLKSLVKEGVSLEDGFFDRKVFLSVSGQLHLEAAAHGLSKVYSLGPIFRAENSKTRHHLSEFIMLEAEVAFLDNIEHLIFLIEHLVKSVTQAVIKTSEYDIKICQQENKCDLSWLDKKFPVITYEQAVNIIRDHKDFIEKDGFTKEQEIFLVNYVGGVPLFIINWPKIMKPFYMRECEDESTKVACLDLLAPNVGEIVGGSLRENDYEKLKSNLPKDNCLDWYLDLRKYGGVPTGGYGLGFERYLMSILGINNVKDVIPFPRWPHNCNL